MARYQTTFHSTHLSDWRPCEFWIADGAADSEKRANARWKELLAAYQPPDLPSDRHGALEKFVAKRGAKNRAKDI